MIVLYIYKHLAPRHTKKIHTERSKIKGAAGVRLRKNKNDNINKNEVQYIR